MFWDLLAAFVLAATPWIELLVVIPLGLAWGLPPIPLAIVVAVGNLATVLPVIWLYDKWRQWRQQRKQLIDSEPGTSRRWERAQRIWNRYGLPGLALAAPLVTGVHLAAVIALVAGSPRRPVTYWMTSAIVLWTIGTTVVSLLGIEAFHYVRELWA